MTKTTSSPRREIAALAIPVSLEMVVALVMNFINQVVVGGLGTTAIAAVGFVNSITFIALITLGALGGSVSIMAARAHGGGRLHELNALVHVALVVGFVTSAALVTLPALFPEHVLRTAGGSSTVIAAGASYLRISAIALLPNIAARVISGVLRSTGHTRGPLIATTVATILNTVMGFVLVYGVGPFPRFGIRGAAIASVIAGLLNLLIVCVMAYGVERIIRWEFPLTRSEWWELLRPLFVFAAPLALTELVWSLGGYLYNVVFQRLGDDALAAAQIAGTLEAVFILASFGLSTATTTLVGRSLGQGDALAATQWIARLNRAGYATSTVFGLLYLGSALLLPWLFPHVSPEVRILAATGIALAAFTQWAKVQNMVIGGGALPSGSDMKGVVAGDSMGVIIGLPAAVLLGVIGPFGFVGVVLGRTVEELVKFAIFTHRLRRVNWQSLAQQHGPASEQ